GDRLSRTYLTIRCDKKTGNGAWARGRGLKVYDGGHRPFVMKNLVPSTRWKIPNFTRRWNPRSRKARDPSTSSGQALGHPAQPHSFAFCAPWSYSQSLDMYVHICHVPRGTLYVQLRAGHLLAAQHLLALLGILEFLARRTRQRKLQHFVDGLHVVRR